MPADFDNPWKELMERFFEMFVAFFFPALHAEIDWSKGYESLDTELRKILPAAEVGKRFVDTLVKAYTATGDERYAHVEVQCQVEDNFLNRLDIYNSLCQLRYNHPVVTQAVLGDNNPDWCPDLYLFECAEFRKEIKFPVRKIFSYKGQEEMLRQHSNPVALLVAAHLLTLTTQEHEPARQEGEIRLLEELLRRNLDTEVTFHFVRLLDWLIPLPTEGQKQVEQAFQALVKEKQMPFISIFERAGYDKGKTEGLREGKTEGLREGKTEGLREGKTEGKIEGLLRGLELALKLKFGAEGAHLLPVIQAQNDPVLLQKILDAVEPSTSPDDIRRLLPHASPG